MTLLYKASLEWRERGLGYGSGRPEPVGELDPETVAEIAARYGARVAPNARAVRVSCGATPPSEIVELPYGYRGAWGQQMLAERKRVEAAADAPPAAPAKRKGGPGRVRMPDGDHVAARRAPAVAACLGRGLSYMETGAELGLTHAQVEETRRYLARHPEMLPPNPRKVRRERLVAEALVLLQEGKRPSEIARALGFPRTHTVYSYLPKDWAAIREAAACARS